MGKKLLLSLFLGWISVTLFAQDALPVYKSSIPGCKELLFVEEGVNGEVSVGGMDEAGNAFAAWSPDQGKTWKELRKSDSEAFLGCSHPFPDQFYLYGGRMGQGLILVSKDAGENWEEIAAPEMKMPIRKVLFLDKNVGFSFTESELYKTIDGGRSWKYVNYFGLSENGGDRIWDMAFKNPGKGLVVYSNSSYEKINRFLVLRTSDGGSSWKQQEMEKDPGTTDLLIRRREDQLFMRVGVTRFVTSNFDSETWKPVPARLNTMFTDMVPIAADHWIGLRKNGFWFRTANGGKTYDYFYLEPGQVIIGGTLTARGSVLVFSADGKVLEINSPSSTGLADRVKAIEYDPNRNALTGFCMTSEQAGFAIGRKNSADSDDYQGVILRTSDGGASWDTVFTGRNLNLQGIQMIDPQTFFAWGPKNLFLGSLDGGANWRGASPMNLTGFKGVQGMGTFDGAHNYFWGKGGLWIDSTRKFYWVQQKLVPDTPNQPEVVFAHLMSPQTGVAVAVSENDRQKLEIFSTQNGGSTWDKNEQELTYYPGARFAATGNRLFYVDQERGLILMEWGKNPVVIQPEIHARPSAFKFWGDRSGIIVMRNGEIWITRDRGNTWETAVFSGEINSTLIHVQSTDAIWEINDQGQLNLLTRK